LVKTASGVTVAILNLRKSDINRYIRRLVSHVHAAKREACDLKTSKQLLVELKKHALVVMLIFPVLVLVLIGYNK